MILHTMFPTPVVIENFEPSNELIKFFKSLALNNRFNDNLKNENTLRKVYGSQKNVQSLENLY